MNYMKRTFIGLIILTAIALTTIIAIARTQGTDETIDGEQFMAEHEFDAPDFEGGGFGGHGIGKHGRRGHHRGNEGGMRAFRDLDLSDEQKTQIQAIFKTGYEKNKPIIDQLQANQSAMRESAANGFDEARIRELAISQGGYQAQLIVERARLQAQAESVLNPEQKQKLAETRKKKAKRMMERKTESEKIDTAEKGE